MIQRLAQLGLLWPLTRIGAAPVSSISHAKPSATTQEPANGNLTAADEQLLEEMEKAACLFFWEQASPRTGLVKDHSRTSAFDDHQVASIAATGFGLTALCIADQRGFFPGDKIHARVLATLKFLRETMLQEHGFFFHFVNVETGARAWNSEVSSIDTSLLLCGVLTCRQYFADSQIHDLATEIYHRVDWAWMLDGGQCLSMGWKPEGGFLKSRWDTYCELMMIYLLGIGSPTHPIPPETWGAWARPIFHYDGLRYIGAKAPLFVHQYSQAWFDFRGTRDQYANYFENSIEATKAHRLFCIGLQKTFPDYSEDLWGMTASDSARGYVVWGGPPPMGPIDGTLVPAAPAGSLPFLARETLQVLHTMRERFGAHAWKRYGFVDAFNPLKKWYDAQVVGIDTGISLLMAENLRSGFVWDTFMKNEAAQIGMKRAGFRPETGR
ncbi:MAG TPA: glucoamylase family protein [Candidatus Limnocylindrales bacterium]|nr:glucoamylase family protein [Candidatus Limnocylindrales bacterium]